MTIVNTLDVVCEVIKESSTHEISNWKKNMYFGYDQEIIIRNPTKYLVLLIKIETVKQECRESEGN